MCISSYNFHIEDIIGDSPPEVALEVFTYLDLQTILACRLVCKYWNALANDSYVWRSLFCREMDAKGWKVDERKAVRDRMSEIEIDLQRRRLLSLSSISSRTTFDSPIRASSVHIPRLAPLSIDWQKLYRTRAELDKRWISSEPKTTRLTGHEDRLVFVLLIQRKPLIHYNLAVSIAWSLMRTKLLPDLATGLSKFGTSIQAISVLPFAATLGVFFV